MLPVDRKYNYCQCGSKMIMNITHEEIKEKLKEKHSYVLITCEPPTEGGKMDVELSFDGDPLVAEYLVQGAVNYFAQNE